MLPSVNTTDDSIVVYKSSDGVVQLDVQLADETVWLTLNQLAVLFDRNKSVISRHISNIYSEGELIREATVAKNATVQNENGRRVVRQIEYYNLDVIISVGYRVKSLRGTQFRQWANHVLKEYLLKGYSTDWNDWNSGYHVPKRRLISLYERRCHLWKVCSIMDRYSMPMSLQRI